MSALIDGQMPLLQECVLPGCHTPMPTAGEPCPDCVTAFGSMLHRSEGPALTAEQIRERDDAAMAAVRAQQALASLRPQPVTPAPEQAPERKRNQTCWMCEERRTCTRTRDGWECDTCRQVTG